LGERILNAEKFKYVPIKAGCYYSTTVEADSIIYQRIVELGVYICLPIHITLFFPLDPKLDEGSLEI
jgi:hypothetical protein